MRKLILLAVAFLLLAAPAFAVDDNVVVEVSIATIGNFSVAFQGSDPWTLNITAGNIGSGPWALGDAHYDVETNDDWTLVGRWDDIVTSPDNPDFPTAWSIDWCLTSGGTYDALIRHATTTEVLDDTATSGNDLTAADVYFQLSGVTIANAPSDTYDAKIFLTLGN